MTWHTVGESHDSMLNGEGPGFTRYTKENFSRLSKQQNIVAIVGNGFDLQVLHDYGQPVDSRYETFYYHLKTKGFPRHNQIVAEMESELLLDQREGGHGDWSDVEASIARMIKNGACPLDELEADLRELQGEFASFLQNVASPSLLTELGQDSARKNWSAISLSQFLGDIRDPGDYKSLTFPDEVGHYQLFNYLFINFNYTTLLDDYIYLDQSQFDPIKHSTVDTNFLFKEDPLNHGCRPGGPDHGQSGYVVTNIVHPHGVLSTPRSLLFGTDAADDYRSTRDERNRLSKPYWARAHLYENHFLQADLFLVFGCSLGRSDGWWWRAIVRGLRLIKTQTVRLSRSKQKTYQERSELIIYWWHPSDVVPPSKESIKVKFLASGGVTRGHSDWEELMGRIHVVVYSDASPRYFLDSKI